MLSRVHIDDGLLLVTTHRGDFDYYLLFELFLVDGSRVLGSFHGDAARVSKDGVNYVNIPRGCDVEEIRIADAPTPDSAERAEGFFFGIAQKRRYVPKNRGTFFMDGWSAAWSERHAAKSKK